MNGWEEFCRIDLESLVAPEILERGFAYFQDGHVLETIRLGPVLAGIVAGTGSNFKARLWLEDGTVYAECSCPYQGFCKHLTALALAWLEFPQNFKNMEPHLNFILQNPELIEETLVRLCHKDPIGFYYLTESPRKHGFHSKRGILNLVRNTFCYRQISHKGSVVLWENVERIRGLLATELRRGNTEGLLPLGDLLKGISTAYLEFPSEILTEAFGKAASLISELPAYFSADNLRFLFEILLDFYFEPKLWEWSEACRRALRSLNRSDPGYLSAYLGRHEFPERTTLELISIVELFKEPDISMNCFEHLLSRIEEELSCRPDGRLWLIDRYSEDEPERAFCLAREGMRLSDSKMKIALRERMVQLHCRRREFKQAASLCFIQFREEPSFEEYLRLKDILRHHPQEWERYYSQAIGFLRGTKERESIYGPLLLRIFLDAGESRKFKDYLAANPIAAETLFEIIDSGDGNITWEATSVFPQIVEGLLTLPSVESWKKALKAIIRYKKICLGTQHFEEWNEFCRRIDAKFHGDRRFHRRFGAILTGAEDDLNKTRF